MNSPGDDLWLTWNFVGLEVVVILLPLPSQCWDHRCIKLDLLQKVYLIIYQKVGFGGIQTLISVFTRNLDNKTDQPTGNDFPKLFLGVLEFHWSRRSVLEFFLSGDYVIGRAFLSRPEQLSAALQRSWCWTAAFATKPWLTCSGRWSLFDQGLMAAAEALRLHLYDDGLWGTDTWTFSVCQASLLGGYRIFYHPCYWNGILYDCGKFRKLKETGCFVLFCFFFFSLFS